MNEQIMLFVIYAYQDCKILQITKVI